MKRLTELDKITPYKTIIALNKKDIRLLDIAKNYNIEIVERNDKSIGDYPTLNETHHYMESFNNEYMMWVNASFPFLNPTTLIDIIGYFNSHIGEGLHCIKKMNNWFWKDDIYKPINVNNIKNVRSQDVENIYMSVQCCHILNRKFILENNIMWDYTENNPMLYKVEDSIEFLDIDTETDFLICKSVYNYLYG